MDILTAANDLINGPRADQYGSFLEQMRSIASAFEAITGKAVDPSDVALLLMLLKLRRNQTAGVTDLDSLTDLCGYAQLYASAFRTPKAVHDSADEKKTPGRNTQPPSAYPQAQKG